MGGVLDKTRSKRGTKIMPDEQSVEDMVDEGLARQAAYRASQTGESFEDALETVIETVAGGSSYRNCVAVHTATQALMSGRQALLGSEQERFAKPDEGSRSI
jgi:hypothetical protein